MSKENILYKIRNFGNDRECDDENRTFESLRKHYAGDHVAVHVLHGNVTKRILFLTVPEEATDPIIDTYTGNPVTSLPVIATG